MASVREQKFAARQRVFACPRPSFLLIEGSKLDAVITNLVLTYLVRKFAT